MLKAARTSLVIVVSLLIICGLSMLYSTSYATDGEAFLKRQLEWIALGGLAAVAICWKLDYRKLGQISWILLCGIGALLAYLALANLLHEIDATRDLARKIPLVGGLSKGSARWLRLGPLSLQPSEIAKPVVILYLANYLPRNARRSTELWRGLLRPVLPVGLVVGLILVGGNLSTTAITGVIVASALFIGGMRLRYLALLTAVGLMAGLAAIKFSEERASRISSYRNPEEVQAREGYQLWHSQLALGSGGLTGLGFTNSRMKRQYLPEAHTDFIVAIIGEEIGFVGIVGIMLLYAWLAGTAFWISALAKDHDGVIVAGSIGVAFAFQAFVNLSVVSGFGPTTGVTAPFLSYGGSSMIGSALMIGLLMSVTLVSEQGESGKGGAETVSPTRRPSASLTTSKKRAKA